MLLCLSLYCAMSIWGNGPLRTERLARSAPQVETPVFESSLKVMPAPQAAAPPPAADVAAAQAPDRTPEPEAFSFAAYMAADDAPALARDTTATTTEPAAAPVAAADPADLPENLQMRWINVGTANVRSAPNKRSALAGKVALGEAVYVMWAEPNGWMRIRSPDGLVTGFVHESLLSEQAPRSDAVNLATAD